MIRAIALFVIALLAFGFRSEAQAATASGVRKIQDIIVYKDATFYSAFPSVVRCADGTVLVAFRRAPERRAFGESSTSHTDPNSYLVSVRSTDQARTWSLEPQLIWAHPFGGSQDPCMVLLSDSSILCTSYAWALLNGDAATKINPALRHGNFCFLGGYMIRSRDAGHTWQNPVFPPHAPGEITLNPFKQPIPAYNRGAMCEGRDGKLFWVVASNTRLSPRNSATHLFISRDRGTTWSYSCPVAQDDKVSFNESSAYQTPSGDLVVFMRTADFDDHTVVARSKDNGQTFDKWQDAGFKGHPHHALKLPDNRVLLVYGYRHPPFGIRARVLAPECDNLQTSQEIILRNDGGNRDLGYPWATMLSSSEALVVYYFNKADGTRHIAGTLLAIE